jgi:molecular chaperone DnaK
MSYQVGVDLGSTYSAAALCSGAAPEIAGPGFVPTVLIANPDGSVVVGNDAERRAPADPQRVVRQFIRRIGDGVPILADDVSWPAELFAARFVGAMLDTVAGRMGGPATRVTITHPAGWGTHRVAALRDALAGQGLFGARFLPAPAAAALAAGNRDSVAVYDLGGSSFEATVVRRDAGGQFVIDGTAEDLELGGLDLDEVVFSLVIAALGTGLDLDDPAVRAAVPALRRECVAAKEALSADTEVQIPVVLPGLDTRVRVGRAEFEDAIRPAIEETVDALRRAMVSASVEPEAVLLIGGSARIPLITQVVSERLGRPPTVAMDTKGIMAIGAALDARGPIAPPTRMLVPVAAPVEPPVIVPPPLTGPPRADNSGRWLGIPRLVVAAVAATVLAGGVAGGLTLLARHTVPASSDADTGAGQLSPKTPVVSQDPPTTNQTATRNKPPVTTTAPRNPKPQTTTTPPRTTTTTTTSKPPSSSSTTTTVSSPASPPTSVSSR